MSSNINNEEYNPAAKLTMQPVRGILKTSKSIDPGQLESNEERIDYPITTTGMTRSESKSHKIPHFDEMNIIATYHPIDKDYGHMKIDEPKTPYAPGENIDEEMETEELASSGVDADILTRKLFESSGSFQISRRSIDENAVVTPENEEHRKQFENHRKKHYNEFEVVRLRKKEIEDELRALEQEETTTTTAAAGSEGKEKVSSIKPILIHDHASHHPSHHVHVEDDDQHEVNEQSLTPDEQERRKQFELKRKQHYNEFRVTHSVDKEDEK